MIKKTILSAIFLAVLAAGVISLGALAQAQSLVPEASGEPCDQGSATYCGNYEINDFIRLALGVSRWILGIVGSLTLMMFIFGGQSLLLSGGSSEKIDKARKMMVAATIGLLIVFSSYLLIKGVLASLGLNWDGNISKPVPMAPANNNTAK